VRDVGNIAAAFKNAYRVDVRKAGEDIFEIITNLRDARLITLRKSKKVRISFSRCKGR